MIDEVEQHLHPVWQKRIVRLLNEGFGKVQFIATTHAPLVAIGAADLDDGKCQIALCERTDRGVTVRDSLNPPRGWRADQVLTSFLFGLRSTSSGSLKGAIDRFAELKKKKTRSSEEKRDLVHLKDFLNKSGHTEIDGHLFRVTVSHSGRDQVAWKRIAIKAGASRQLIIANTKTIPVDSVRCVARKTS